MVLVVSSGGVVLLQLLDWLRMHFVAGFSVAQECLREEYPEEHPSYWEAVKRLVLQGSVEEARRLLSAHSNRDQSILIIDQLLKTMPVFTVSSSSCTSFLLVSAVSLSLTQTPD